MQAEQMPAEGRSPVSLFPSPGIREWVDPGLGIGRGITSRNGYLYALCGATFCRITVAGDIYELGQVPGEGKAYFSNNGLQTVIVASPTHRLDDAVAYVETGDVVSPITDEDFTALRVGEPDFIDNYVAFVEYGSGRWFISDLLDLTSFDSLDFATAETSPDLLYALRCINEQVYLFGTNSIERWYNSGTAGFPFERVPGGSLKLGIGAPRSVVTLEGQSLAFLANDLTFRRMGGSGATRISHHGVEEALKKMSKTADCEGFSYTHEGHICAVWNFLEANQTWVYDATTQEFHERDSYPGKVWRACDSVALNGITYVQDRQTGAIGIMDASCNTEWGDTIRREWAYANITHNGKLCFHHTLQTDMKVGAASASGAGSHAAIRTEWSDNGGPFIAGRTDSLGRYGNRRKIVYSSGLGSSYDRVYRRIISDPVAVNVYDTFLEMEVAK
jgi:hypothetical protein